MLHAVVSLTLLYLSLKSGNQHARSWLKWNRCLLPFTLL